MAIFNYTIVVKATIKDIETDAERIEIFTKKLTTMHAKNSEKRAELTEVAINELIDEIEEDLLDVEKLESYTYKLEE